MTMHRNAFLRNLSSLILAGAMLAGMASCGGGGGEGNGGGQVRIMPPDNRSPVVQTGILDVPSMTVGGIMNVDLSDVFSDPDRDALTYTARSSAPELVRATMSGSRLRFTAVQAFSRSAVTITGTARDPHGATAEVSFQVLKVVGTSGDNRAPIIRDRFQDLTHTVSSVSDERRTWTFDLASYFSDPDGDNLTYSATTSNPFFAEVSVTGSQLNVTSGLDGSATITVTATDPGRLTASQSFRLTTTFRPQRNRSPVVRDRYRIVFLHYLDVGRSKTVDVSVHFSDPDGDTLTYSARSSSPDLVRVAMSGSMLTLTAVRAFSDGGPTITLAARDPHGATVEYSFDVIVAVGGNRAPVVQFRFHDVTSMTVGDRRTVDVSRNFSDPDGDRLTYSVRSSASHVRAAMSGSTLTFTAEQAFSRGAVRITVTARDPHGETAEVSFQVLSVSAPARRYYGALAVSWDGCGGCKFGWVGLTNRTRVETLALDECRRQGGRSCQVIEEFGSAYGRNEQCIALAYGERRSGNTKHCRIRQGTASSLSAAQSVALADCRSGGFSCSLVSDDDGRRGLCSPAR